MTVWVHLPCFDYQLHISTLEWGLFFDIQFDDKMTQDCHLTLKNQVLVRFIRQWMVQ